MKGWRGNNMKYSKINIFLLGFVCILFSPFIYGYYQWHNEYYQYRKTTRETPLITKHNLSSPQKSNQRRLLAIDHRQYETKDSKWQASGSGGFFLFMGPASASASGETITTQNYEVMFCYDQGNGEFVFSQLPISKIHLKFSTNDIPTIELRHSYGNGKVEIKYATITVKESDWTPVFNLPMSKDIK